MDIRNETCAKVVLIDVRTGFKSKLLGMLQKAWQNAEPRENLCHPHSLVDQLRDSGIYRKQVLKQDKRAHTPGAFIC